MVSNDFQSKCGRPVRRVTRTRTHLNAPVAGAAVVRALPQAVGGQVAQHADAKAHGHHQYAGLGQVDESRTVIILITPRRALSVYIGNLHK